MSITDKFKKVLDNKNAVRDAINAKGGTVDDKFSTYGDAILALFGNIETGLATLVDVVVSEPTIPTVPTDLNGYKVTVPSGWSVSENYGEFNIQGSITTDEYSRTDTLKSSDVSLWFGVETDYPGILGIFYYVSGWSGYEVRGGKFTLNITGGTDTTNTSLIQWFIDNNATFEKPTLISFTIAGTSYQAEEGMTWEEWISSSYNTGGLVLDSGNGVSGGTLGMVCPDGSSVSEKGANVIIADYAYIYHIHGGGGGND